MYPKFMVAVALTLIPLGAAEFWEQKKFTDWNEKQVRRMLEDSPWARPVAVSDTGRAGRIARGNMGDASAKATSRDSSTSRPPEAAPTVTAILQWRSALPLRQAVVRMRFGKAAGKSPEGASLLNREEDRYVCAIGNLPAGVVEGSAEQLKAAIRLKVNGKPDIVPEDVRNDAQGDGRSTLLMSFPKGRNGAQTIDVNDGEIELEVRLPDLKIERKFKLKEMMFNGKLEL